MRTVCNAPSCIRAWDRDQKAARTTERASNRKHGDRYVGWGYGEIVRDLRRRERQKRRGKGKAL